MRIKLEFEFNIEDEHISENPTTEEMKEELTQSLFEICEDWVLRGQTPELEFSEVEK